MQSIDEMNDRVNEGGEIGHSRSLRGVPLLQ